MAKADAYDLEALRTRDLDDLCREVAAPFAIDPPKLDRSRMSFEESEVRITRDYGPDRGDLPGFKVQVFVPIVGDLILMECKPKGYIDTRDNEGFHLLKNESELRLDYKVEASALSKLKLRIEEDLNRIERILDDLAQMASHWNSGACAKVRKRFDIRLLHEREVDWESTLGMPRRKKGEGGEERSGA